MTVLLRTKAEFREAVTGARTAGASVGLVPTMGALHEGHLSLVRAARAREARVIVSVFVNPTQFDSAADLAAYPADLEGDLAACAEHGVDWVFAPSVGEMYGGARGATVEPGPLAARWEGEHRPGHFAGVATVVTKLLAVARADTAYFGEKDYQQLRIVEGLARDLDLGTRIVGLPTVREPDGLALSSRNRRLGGPERAAATWLFRAMEAAAAALAGGERDAGALEAAMREVAGAEPLARPDYLAVVDPVTLEPLTRVDADARALVAGSVGNTRLIDNIALRPSGPRGA